MYVDNALPTPRGKGVGTNPPTRGVWGAGALHNKAWGMGGSPPGQQHIGWKVNAVNAVVIDLSRGCEGGAGEAGRPETVSAFSELSSKFCEIANDGGRKGEGVNG